MKRGEQGPAIVFAVALVAVAVGWLGWLMLSDDTPPAEAVRRGPRFSEQYNLWLAETFAAHERFMTAREAGDPAAAYQSGRELREGLRSLLRGAPVSSGSVEVAYAPQAEDLVAELLREDAARGDSVRQALGEDGATRLFDETRRLEEQLDAALVSLRRDDQVALAQRHRDFDAAFAAWRALAEPPPVHDQP